MRKAVWLIMVVGAVGLIGGVKAFSGAAAPEDMCVPMGKIVLKAPDARGISAPGRGRRDGRTRRPRPPG